MEKVINIGGKEVGFKATASTTRRYRQRFGSDLFADMSKIIVNANALTAGDLQCFENIAYIMAQQFDPANVPNDPDEWLDEFEMFSIYEILPEIVELWGVSNQTLSETKKKADQQSGK